MSELRHVQHNVEILRSRIYGVDALRDMSYVKARKLYRLESAVLKNAPL